MDGEWESVLLDTLIEPGRGISYGIVQPGVAVPDGVPIVRVSDVRNGRISTLDPLRVSPNIEAAYSRTRLVGGELLLTIVGTIGETAIVPVSLAGWNTARAIAVIPVRKDVGSYWVQMALSGSVVRRIIDSRLNTTVQPTLNLRDVAQLPIVLPPKAVRDAISEVMGNLDDKINLNRQMSDTLEGYARALFKSWFVDFDPVHAKFEGRDIDLPNLIASLFPDRFVESEGRVIPMGWQVRGLDGIARFLNGLALQKYPPKDGRSLPVIKIAQLRSGKTTGAEVATSELPIDYVVEDSDVLFSWSGSLECVLWTGGRGALNQHLFKVTSDEFPKWFYYLWIQHHLADFRHIAEGKATTMGHIQRHHLSEAKVAVPDANFLNIASKVISPLIDRIIATRIESRTLGTLRDPLLAKLVSGVIRVNRTAQPILDGK